MTNRQYCQLLLACKDAAEADRIATALLEQRLVVCAKQAPIAARYWWKDALEQADETLLLMEGAADLFDAVEAEVTKLHSYDAFVLEAVPLVRISSKAAVWIDQNLTQESN